MSREAARIDITTAVSAAASAWIAYPMVVDYENRELVDYALQVKPFLGVDLVYHDGEQMDIGVSPLVGAYGSIALAVCVPEGKGTSEPNLVMDYFTSNLQLKQWSLVRTGVARPQPSVSRKGWYCLVTLINFWYYEPA